MIRRRVLAIMAGVCMLLEGCGAGNGNTDVPRQDLQTESITAEPAEEAAGGGKDAEPTGNETGSGKMEKQPPEEEESTEEEEGTEEPFPAVPYAAAYWQFLEEYMEEKEYADRARVALALIDDDNLPELLLIEDNIHARGVKVYTYYQESVKELGEFGSAGTMQYVERGGMILGSFTGMGENYAGFFRVEEGEAEPVCEMRDCQWSDGSHVSYEIDGVSVTQEAYHEKWEELYDTDDYQVIGYEDAFSLQESEPRDLIAKAVDTLLLHRKSPRFEEMEAKQSEVLEEYGMFLTDYMLQWKESGSGGREEVPGFALTYLDNDDVPELIVIEGHAHACGVSVYTFEKGAVVPVGVYGQYGAMGFREKEGIIFDDCDTGGSVYSNVYQVKGSRETLLQIYSEKYVFPEAGEELQYTYTVDGKEVSEEEYRKVSDKWNDTECRVIDYGMCRILTDDGIQKDLKEELGDLILSQEEVLKQNVLIAAGAPESKILLLDYDDYDRDGKCEVFMLCGDSSEDYGDTEYRGVLYFAGADCCVQLRNQGYRMIDGKMKLGPDRKYLFFHTDFCFTANISEIWTVEDGKPVESEFSRMGQVVYRGGDEFEIWMDAYDNIYEKADEMWIGHTYKPYFYYYNYSSNRIEAYRGEEISGETFEEISGTNFLEEIEAEGYTVGTIILWENDIVTINYEVDEEDASGSVIYENIIWDNRVKDFWLKDMRGVTSWKNAGEGGSFWMG